jgi:hypothetical protein
LEIALRAEVFAVLAVLDHVEQEDRQANAAMRTAVLR